jgi:hypothetical protein
MRRLTLGALALCAAAAVMFVVSASAFAVTLGEFTVETKAKSPKQKVTSTFETPDAFEGKLESTELESEQVPTSKQLGTLHIMFFGVKCVGSLLGTAAAESLGDEKEMVLVLGEYHIVDTNKILLLINPVHIECLFSSGTVLLEVKGDLLGELSPTGKKTTAFKLKVEGSAGKQKITEYENNSGTKVKPKLETSNNEGTEQASDQNESKEVSLETEKETELT